MRIDIRIISTDEELGMFIIGKHRFPSRWGVLTPGKALVSSESLMPEEGNEGSEIIDLGIDIDEDTSVGEFATWLYDKLEARAEKISFVSIAGKEVSIDKAEILRVIEEAVG
ncbi:MAG: hypothetical protein ACYC56_14445 [Candidatus Aquicultor sp.]